MALIEISEFVSNQGFPTINDHSFLMENPRFEPNSEISINTISSFRNIFSRHPQVVYFAFLWPESLKTVSAKKNLSKTSTTPLTTLLKEPVS